MRRALHALLLIFAFLFAQAGMVAHAAEHFNVEQQQDGGLAAESVCDLCVGYAQLGAGALPACHVPLPVCMASAAVLPAPSGFLASISVFQIRARAPPVFS